MATDWGDAVKHTLLLALVPLLAAGCIAAEPADPGDNADDQPQPDQALGDLHVRVTDASTQPIHDATVTTEEGHETRTGPDGQAILTELPPGPVTLHVDANGYQPLQRTTHVAAGTTTETTLLLQETTKATVQRFELNGFFECSATYLIITGDCFAPARALTDELGGGPQINASNHRFTFPFQAHEGWSTIHITQTWEEGTLTAGSMMRINLEPDDPDTREGHSPRFARAEGGSSLELTLHAGETHATASEDAPTPTGQPLDLRTRTFHLGLEETHRPAGTGYLGAGAAVQQPFTVIIEVTYP